jgi:hypothetical protein
MPWSVEYTEEFRLWWEDCTPIQQDAIDSVVGMLEAQGPH